jgi:putative PEP-CTERM system TPR-repeat lipoprotein
MPEAMHEHRRRLSASAVLLLATLGGLTTVACGSADSYVAAGDKYAAAKQYPESIVEYRRALKRDPRSAKARLHLADAYMHLNDLARATQEYLVAAELLPDDAETQLKAAAMVLVGQDFADVLVRTERLLQKDPNNVAARVMHANATAGLTRFDAAISEIQQAIALDPTHSGPYGNLGALQLATGASERAERTFRHAVEVEPRSTRAHLMLASYYWAAGRFADAEQSLQRAVAIDPGHLGAHRALAVFYLGANRAADAEAHLKAIAEAAPSIEADLALADFYVAMKRPAEAMPILQRIGRQPAGYSEARSRIAALEYAAGRHAEAHTIIDAALAHDPSHVRALLTKAEFLIRDHEPDEALKRAQAAVDADPSSVAGHYTLGSIYASRLQVDEAIAEFEEVLKLNPRAGAAHMELARLQLARGDVDRATDFAEEAVKNGSGSVDPSLLLVRAFIAKRDIVHAESALRPLLALHPELAPVQWLSGAVHLAKREMGPARDAFERALKIQPDALEPLDGLIAIDIAAGDAEKARARVEARLAQRPDAALLVLAAKTYQVTGDSRKAEATLHRAAELDPSNPEPRELLGRLYWSQRHPDLAIRQFEAMAKNAPRSAMPHAMLATIYQAGKRLADAQRELEKVHQLDPADADAANNLAWLYAEQGGNLDVALQLAQQAKRRWPERPDINDTLGWVYYKREQPSLAISPFKTCIEREPGAATCHYHLGLAYAKTGDARLARQSLATAVKINPTFEGAQDARKVLGTIQ